MVHKGECVLIDIDTKVHFEDGLRVLFKNLRSEREKSHMTLLVETLENPNSYDVHETRATFFLKLSMVKVIHR